MEDDQRLHTLVHEVTLYGLRFTIARTRAAKLLLRHVSTVSFGLDPLVFSIRLLVNRWPGRTTDAACFSVPIIDCNWRFDGFVLDSHCRRDAFKRDNFC